jgi:hypothetical protein
LTLPSRAKPNIDHEHLLGMLPRVRQDDDALAGEARATGPANPCPRLADSAGGRL